VPAPDHVRVLLLAGLGNFVTADNADDGFARIQAIAGEKLDPALFHDAIAACLRDGTIKEPVRLPEGALHCHWRLELTPKGVQAARALAGA
jgi:hypothetical protein